MKRKSFSNKKKNYSIRLQKTVPPLPAQPAYRMQVSCATDRGPKSSNEDYYGFRHGSEIITFDQFRNSFITELSGHDDLVAAVADGVTMTWHPDNPEEDAQAIAVKYLLNTDYYRFNMDQQVPFIADDLNNLVLSTSVRLGGLMATTISAAGIHNGMVRIMYIGDSPIIRIHQHKVTMITPVKYTSWLDDYLGNPLAYGSDMVSVSSFPASAGDWLILATDGVTEALTLPDHSLDENLLLTVLETDCTNPAGALVKISGERIVPGTGHRCEDNRTAVVIRIMEADDGENERN